MANQELLDVVDIPLGVGGRHRTFEEFATRNYMQIADMANALEASYPAFLAVLTPERNFLHYVLSGLVCNAAITSRDDLFEKAERIYSGHVAEVTARHEALNESMGQELEQVKEMTASYLNSRKMHQPSPAQMPTEWRRFFEDTYETIQRNIAKGAYLPGANGRAQGLSTFDEVFGAICMDHCQRRQNEAVAKQVAHEVIAQEISEGTLHALPEYDQEHRCNMAIAGIIGAGKNFFFNKMVKEKHLKREDYAFIDLDEFKHFSRIVEKPSGRDGGNYAFNVTWSERAHDECHMIRRKIIDELEQKAQQGKAPNALLLTSHVSHRVLNWLTRDNPKTNVYLISCSPYQAVDNAWERHTQHGDRRTATNAILNSAISMATTTAYLLSQVTQGSRLSIQMEDTTHARENGSTTVFKADAKNGIHVYNMKALMSNQCNISLNPDAEGSWELYLPKDNSTNHGTQANEVHTGSRVSAILRPHAVSLYAPGEKQPYAKREKGGPLVKSRSDVPREERKWVDMLDETTMQGKMSARLGDRNL